MKNADQQRDDEINDLLQRIKYKGLGIKADTFVIFPITTTTIENNTVIKQKYNESLETIKYFEELKEIGAIEIISCTNDEKNKTLEESLEESKNHNVVECYLVKPIEPKFSQLCKKYKDMVNEKPEKIISSCWIRKENDNFKYKSTFLAEISGDTDYYNCFDSLYCIVPNSGFVTYEKLWDEVKKRIPKTKRMTKDKFIKFIQRNLTDEHNGFLHYAKIKNSVAGGKKLIKTIRGKGIEFNNAKNG